jgi:hypothetical protein
MKRHRKIVPTTLLPVVLGALALIPAPAVAGSLLNGYGGPGEGNQAILGSALLNGPRGGGGGGGGSTGDSSSSLAESPPVEATRTGPRAGGGSTEPVHSTASGRGSTTGGHGGEAKVGGSGSAGKQASGGAASAYAAVERGVAARLASDGSGTLGLSSGDFLYILLAFGVLIVTGVLTRRLTRVATASTDS